MRTPQTFYPTERIISHPELPVCPLCRGPLVRYNYLAWDKTVQTLERVRSLASRPGHGADPACPGHPMRLRSAVGQQQAPPGSAYGYAILARSGWLPQTGRATAAELHATLVPPVQVSVEQVRSLSRQGSLPLLACHERQPWDRLAQAAQQHQGLILALDGLAPEGGEPQRWCIRALRTGLTLRSGWLSQQEQAPFVALLAPVAALPWPIRAVLSDKQRGLVPAVAEVFAHAWQQRCQAHSCKHLAEPLAAAAAACKVAVRKALRQGCPALGADAGPQLGGLPSASGPGEPQALVGLVPLR